VLKAQQSGPGPC